MEATVVPDHPDTAFVVAESRGYAGEAALDVAKAILVAPEAATLKVDLPVEAVAVSLIELSLAQCLAEVSASLNAVRSLLRQRPGMRPSRMHRLVGATYLVSAVCIARVEEALAGVPLHMVLPGPIQRAVAVQSEYGRRCAVYGDALSAGRKSPWFLDDVQGFLVALRVALHPLRGYAAQASEDLVAAYLAGGRFDLPGVDGGLSPSPSMQELAATFRRRAPAGAPAGPSGLGVGP